ncbi:MspA protein [Rhodococcus sp. SMB37]|uniref:MspA family porin n=1 Tax=Rhodococcus sp. SMB37 TaxID=2512213 RepID=UPI00104DE165|nr:MspA family porin [Rhodococcus sp. SMB37]TCN54753.1 MspA protein [Rhodococcus sp. SMB37]
MGIKSRGFKAARNSVLAGAAVLGMVVGASGAASAEVNDQNRIVSDGLEVVVTQEDTFIHGVPALGGSPFNREFFHNGRGTVNLLGENAAKESGTTMQFGYQFAWAGSIDGAIGVTYSTPGLGVDAKLGGDVTAKVTDILPQAYAELELTPAPGIEELVVAEGEFDGDFKTVQFSNVHGTASGVLGAVQVRPFVRAITANGDNVTTYGQAWTV